METNGRFHKLDNKEAQQPTADMDVKAATQGLSIPVGAERDWAFANRSWGRYDVGRACHVCVP